MTAYGFGQIRVGPKGATCKCGDCGLVMTVERLLPDERAVIEAAEAVFDGFRAEDLTPDYWKTDTVLDYRLHDLFSKLEALLAAKEQ